MRRSLLSSLRAHLGRLIAACLTIVLGVGFGTVTLTTRSTASHVIDEAIGSEYKGIDVVVAPRNGSVTEQDLTAVRRVPGVQAVQSIATSYLQTTWSGDRRPSMLDVQATNDAPGLPFPETASGRMPRSATEIALPQTLADKHKLTIGSHLQAKTFDDEPVPMTVVGLVADKGVFDDAPAIADRAAVAKWAGEAHYDELKIAGSPRSQETLAAAVSRMVGDGTQTLTGPAWIEKRTESLTGDIDVLSGVFGMFAVIAIFVACLVIANIFTILIAQRTREMALLRCVGASRKQIFGSVLAEAAVVGVVASAAGVLFGLGVTAAGLALAARFDWGIPNVGVHPNVTALLAPFLVGAIATLLAAIVPARRATRVAPLAALRPIVAVASSKRAGVVRMIFGALLIGGGGLLLAVGAAGHAVLIGVAGGLLSFLGVLVVGAILVPALVRLAGALPARGGGVPARLAVANAIRNPRRTAATTSALLIGVTLISLTCVGIASVQRTFDVAMDDNYPVDLMISADRGTLPGTAVQQVRGVDGITAATPVLEGTAKLHSAELTVLGMDPTAARSVGRGDVIGRLGPGVALASPVTLRGFGLQDGSQAALKAGGTTLTVRFVAVNSVDTILLSDTDLRRLDPEAKVTSVWADAANDADGGKVLHDVNEAVTGVDELSVGGGLAERTGYTKVFDVLLVIAIALLAVSVLIALVGVGNTLSLSVLERTRENALLRALGITRRQLRGMLAAESLLMATVAAGLGIVLGLVYGWTGTAALMGGQADRLAYDAPVKQLATVALVAAAAGLLASVLPARRAAKVAPAAALADE